MTPVGRADLLQRLSAQREACIENAPFLALLGALWLEQGDPGQALVWLERALLLEPRAQGARLDHALALARMGELDAAQTLYIEWQHKADVPPVVLHRLRAAIQGGAAPVVASAPPEPVSLGWRFSPSVSVSRGYEDNLDRSPTLSEIRLTPPEGPITLPLAVPIAPRKGQTWLTEAALQAHRSTGADTLWQTGLLISWRQVSQQSADDQRSVQFALGRWHQVGASQSSASEWIPSWLLSAWRIQNQISLGTVQGSAAANHHQARYLIAAESDWNWGPGQCVRRLEGEWTHQRYTGEALLSSNTPALTLAADCRRVNGQVWTWGAHVRWGQDQPLSAERPGGRQSQWSAGLRMALELGGRWGLEAALRSARLTDDEGFSPLLEGGAPRRQTQWLATWEARYRLSPPQSGSGSRWEAWVQWQHLRQGSNIELFRYNANTAYAGLRWRP
ncbi:tetratricopeptide repeat protein [Inhella gelatinilytica]|uniref:Tetratricopeptide repeat protein n=1 Tax=Inhella gelatinilytica TaxID=2795030 RepID=A0A931IR90_9BURK|nr:tetratricopeptide repeat protein [Inhella gelatinilytica]MBH9551215.1 tetratricopeptide repeat protein [Inhella gelatinilytica]